MWSAWYRRLRPGLYHTVGGKACSGGFDISITFFRTGWKGLFVFRTEEYQPEAPLATDWGVVLGTAAVVGLLVALHVWWPLPALLYFALRPAHQRVFQKFGKDWHWCEHQVAAVLDAGEYPDATLRTVSPISVRCGSMDVWLASLLALSLSWQVHAYFQSGPSVLATLAMYSCMASMSVHVSHFWRRWQRFHRCVFVLCLVIGTPAILVALALQRICVLRRPMVEQEKLALFWAQEAAIIIAKEKMKDASMAASSTTP